MSSGSSPSQVLASLPLACSLIFLHLKRDRRSIANPSRLSSIRTESSFAAFFAFFCFCSVSLDSRPGRLCRSLPLSKHPSLSELASESTRFLCLILFRLPPQRRSPSLLRRQPFHRVSKVVRSEIHTVSAAACSIYTFIYIPYLIIPLLSNLFVAKTTCRIRTSILSHSGRSTVTPSPDLFKTNSHPSEYQLSSWNNHTFFSRGTWMSSITVIDPDASNPHGIALRC